MTRMSAQASAEQRLSELDIALPPPPTPFGAYVETVKIGNLFFLRGMLPVVGHELQYVGRVGGALSAMPPAGSAVPDRLQPEKAVSVCPQNSVSRTTRWRGRSRG